MADDKRKEEKENEFLFFLWLVQHFSVSHSLLFHKNLFNGNAVWDWCNISQDYEQWGLEAEHYYLMGKSGNAHRLARNEESQIL